MKIRILFVDDEVNLLKGLERMLFSLRKQWDMTFVDSAERALEILAQSEYDVIITDMRMPKMDGAALLEIIKVKYPKMIRVILSGHSDKENSIKSTKTAHQFLAKPCDSETIKNKIEKTIKLRNMLQQEKLLGLINGIENLPVLPKIYTELENELKMRDISLGKIGDIIARDITLSAKLLQVVNSAFFGISNKISNVSQAVNYLGIEIIKSLILSIGLMKNTKLPKSATFFIEPLWEHSFEVGRIAREIARYENFDKIKIEEAFTAGILHDIGKIVLLNMEGYFNNVLSLMDEKELSFENAERELYGASHAEIGGYLIGVWGLPDSIVEAVAYHPEPQESGDNEFNILTCVHIANALAVYKLSENKKNEDLSDIVHKINFDYLKIINIEEKIIKYLAII